MSSVNFPVFNDDCVVDPNLEVEKFITLCDDAAFSWSGFPDTCGEAPQGYHVWRTTTPPTNTAVGLCIGIDDSKRMVDGSIYGHSISYYTDKSYKQILYTSLTPWGVQATRNGFLFNRNLREYYKISYSDQFNLENTDFTIEMWVGRNGEPWYYNFPCETIISSYDAENNGALWRIFFEPRDATRSVTTAQSGIPYGLNGYSADGSDRGSLVIEFGENGDGVTGQRLTQVVMSTTSNPNPNYSFSGATLRNGYSHLCVTRKDNTLTVYVDGVSRGVYNMPFQMANVNQSITLGRHTGESLRLDAGQFSDYYGLTGAQSFPYRDGDRSYFHGSLYDVRIIKTIALPPPLGGRDDGICNSEVWYETFEKQAALPSTITNYKDPTMPLDMGVYYRVTAVQCGKDIPCECPNYISIVKESAQEYVGIAVNNQDDLDDALYARPPTLLDVFNSWDRADFNAGNYYLGGAGAGGDHAAWYFDNNLDSFVQPNNASVWASIVSPQDQWMKTYTHQCVLQSNNGWDDDLVGMVAAVGKIGNQYYAIQANRTRGGMGAYNNWSISINTRGYSHILKSFTLGGNGAWAGRTSRVNCHRNGSVFKFEASNFGSSSAKLRDDHTVDATKVYEINMATDPPPPGLGNWDMFRGRTGYGFVTVSQEQSFYNDWHLYPNPNLRIFDFNEGAPGVVWDFNVATGKWERNAATAWEIVGKTATTIQDGKTGKVFGFSCAGDLSVT
jgi:hypothetical protein